MREELIHFLLPPDCREQVFGDLRESARSWPHPALTLPALILSQMRRSTPARLALAQFAAAYSGFVVAEAWNPGDPAAWIAPLLPAAVAALLLIAAGPYDRDNDSSMFRRVRLALAGTTLTVLAAALILPLRTAAGGAVTAFFLITAVRAPLPVPEAGAAQPERMPMPQLRASLRLLHEEIRRRQAFRAIAAVAVIFAVYLFIFPFPLERAGLSLILVGCLLNIFQSRRMALKGSPDPGSDSASDEACLGLIRCELVRLRDCLRNARNYTPLMFLTGILLFNAATKPIQGVAKIEYVGITAGLAMGLSMNLWLFRKYQRQIGRLPLMEEAQ